MSQQFTATHEITHNGRSILVHESDGALYTRAEWEASEAADWELDTERGLLFQGQVPSGESSYRARPYHERRREMAHCPECLSPDCYAINCDEREQDERDEGP